MGQFLRAVKGLVLRGQILLWIEIHRGRDWPVNPIAFGVMGVIFGLQLVGD